MLALMLVFSLATVAMAVDDAPSAGSTGTSVPSERTSLTFNKNYTISGGNRNAAAPGETVSFTVAPDATSPQLATADNVPTIAPVAISGTTNTVTITLDTTKYTTVGRYNYTVTENHGHTQGVVYADGNFNIQVLAYYDGTVDATTGKQVIKTDIALTTPNGQNKLDTFENTYNLGKLTVTKNVDGNLGSQDTYFEMTVTFTAGTYTENGQTTFKPVLTPIAVVGELSDGNRTDKTAIAPSVWKNGSVTNTFYLKHGETISFENIPDGISYSVVEDSDHLAADANGSNPATGYTVKYDGDARKTAATGKIVGGENANASAATVLNTKETEIQTGITLDSLPFVLILAVCAGAVVLFVIKRRNSVEF